MTTTNKALNQFNTSAADFDMEAFNDIIKDVRNTRRQVVEFGSDFDDTRDELAKTNDALKAAIADLDLDEITKLTADCKRLKAKLASSPVTKIQAYDEAMNKLHAFFEKDCKAVKADNVEDINKDKAAWNDRTS